MPPKKKSAVAQATVEEGFDSTSPLMENMISFEEILNKRLTEHTKELNVIVMKSKEALQNDLKAIQASQQFMSDKFDQILTEITQLKAENVQLKREVNELNDKLRSRSSSDIGYANTDNKLYINESLTIMLNYAYYYCLS